MSLPAILSTRWQERAGGYEFGWSFGGGTAMMIQIGHRESHDVDICIDDGQILGLGKG